MCLLFESVLVEHQGLLHAVQPVYLVPFQMKGKTHLVPEGDLPPFVLQSKPKCNCVVIVGNSRSDYVKNGVHSTKICYLICYFKIAKKLARTINEHIALVSTCYRVLGNGCIVLPTHYPSCCCCYCCCCWWWWFTGGLA